MRFSLALDIIWGAHKLPGGAEFGESRENLPSLSPHCIFRALCAGPQHSEHNVSQQVAQLLIWGLLKREKEEKKRIKKKSLVLND